MNDEAPRAPHSATDRARALGNVVIEAGRLELVVGFCAKAVLAPLAVGTRAQVLANMPFSVRGSLIAGSLEGAPFTDLDGSLHEDYKTWWNDGALPAMGKRNNIVHSALLFDTSGGMIGHSIKLEKKAAEQESKTGVSAVDQMRVSLEDWHGAAEDLRKHVEPGIALARRISSVTESPTYARYSALAVQKPDGSLNF